MSPNTNLKIKEQTPYNDAIMELLADCYQLAQKSKTSGIKVIERAIKKYPRIPQFYNYQAIWYRNAGKQQKYEELVHQINNKFPDYLFGKINLVNVLISNEKYEEVIQLFGDDDFNLKKICPNQDAFYQTEIVAIENAAFKYFLELNKIEKAQERLDNLKNLGIDEEVLEELTYQLRIKTISGKLGNMSKLKKYEQPATAKTAPPKFNHKETEQLYKYQYLDKEQIDSFLALPRETFIADLEKVLADSYERYSYFSENEGVEEKDFFPIHALLLLKELKGTESVPAVLDFLSQTEDFYEFYLGDFVTEDLWKVIVGISDQKVALLFDYLKRPKNYAFVRSAVSTAIVYIAYQNPSQKTTIVEKYGELLEYFLENKGNDDICDISTNDLIVSDIMDLNAKELLPIINRLVEADLLSEYSIENIDKIGESISEKSNFTELYKMNSAVEIYKFYK